MKIRMFTTSSSPWGTLKSGQVYDSRHIGEDRAQALVDGDYAEIVAETELAG